MNNYYFTEENTQGFTMDEITQMNEELNEKCAEQGIDIDNVEPHESDIVKHIADTISDSM